MKALVSIAIILITAGVVVVGANAVTGEGGDGKVPVAASDPCKPNPPVGKEPVFYPLECMTMPGQPERTPIGWKPAECPPDLLEQESEFCENVGQSMVPDFGPVAPSIEIGGKRVELPEDVIIGGPAPGGDVIEIIIGDSSVAYRLDGTLFSSDIKPADDRFQPILDALSKD